LRPFPEEPAIPHVKRACGAEPGAARIGRGKPLYNGPLSGYSAPSPITGAPPMAPSYRAALWSGASFPREVRGP